VAKKKVSSAEKAHRQSLKRREHNRELRSRLRDHLLAGLLADIGPQALADALDRMVRRELDPAAAARLLADKR